MFRLLSGVMCLCWSLAALAGEPIFAPVKIDGPVHDPANHTYWFGPFSECCSVADFDGDGDLDIAAGRNWYEKQGGGWLKHAEFRGGSRVNGPETENNSEFAMDVNFDGRPDVVGSGWMHDKGAFWYENPGPQGLEAGAEWKTYRIHTAKSMEGVVHGDIDGDGDDDILCNHWALEPGQGMTWLEHTRQAPWFVEHIIGSEGESHGNGLGDINGDGRTDIATPTGWWECPPRAGDDDWTFHADYLVHLIDKPESRTAASHPMLVHDCNGDGKNDIIVGIAHDYGLAWLEQVVDAAGKRSFETHWIERDFGQCHTMALGDLNGDGKADLVTGKRLFAHHGRDISCYDPLFGFWYEIDSGRFARHILYFNHLPWYSAETNINPPPNGAISMGMKVVIEDMDNNGRRDVVVSGKSGLYVFYNLGEAPRGKQPMRLLPESTYPNWQEWGRLPLPEPAAIPRKIHGAGVAPSDAKKVSATDRRAAGSTGDWTILFDGKNLDAWQMGPDKSWVIENGVIALRRANFDAKEHNLDYLWTRQPYGDFILELEFKVPQRANSGVFLRTAELKNPVYTGMEVQVSNSYGRPDLSRGGTAGAIYDCLAPTKNAAKAPNQWQQMRITCQGPKIAVELNGVLVNLVDLDRWTEAGRNPDGSPNKFPRALEHFARSGYIGLQDHGLPVWYRNVRIKSLNAGN